MIQDIFPDHLYNQYDPAALPEAGDSVMRFDGSKILLRDGKFYPQVRDFAEGTALTYLFRLEGERFFLCRPESVPEGCEYIETMTLRRQSAMTKPQIYAAMTGKHLSDWYRDTKFCGRCGSPMEHSDKERCRVCPSCGYHAYPRIMPAVIVGVTNGDKLLLTKYRIGYGHNALIAGFTEIGETAEETVAREVMEEAGVRVKNIRYYKSQPWGMPNDLLMGFYCDVDGDTEIHMDAGELKYAQWVAREDIELQPDNFSLTNEMMYRFKMGLPLPGEVCYAND